MQIFTLNSIHTDLGLWLDHDPGEPSNRHTIQSFKFHNTNDYNMYRLTFPTIVNSNTTNSLQIAEIELLPHGEIADVAFSVRQFISAEPPRVFIFFAQPQVC